MPDCRVSEAVEQAARRSYGRLLAFLAARSRDVTASEDCLADAFHAALTTWPRDGIPDNPDAWLLTVARRRAIDAGFAMGYPNAPRAATGHKCSTRSPRYATIQS